MSVAEAAAGGLSSDALAAHGREAITKGSQSFAAASVFFDARTRADAEMLYAWCRVCDDRIDGQVLGHGMTRGDPVAMAEELQRLRAETRDALAGRATADPAFAGFQQVALRRGIPERYPFALLDGFAMDAEGRRYETLEDLLAYCFGVAGAVGVMMAVVMGVAPDDLPTLRRAQDLGLAMQLTNIARDVVEDARADRVYLPLTWLPAGVEAEALAGPEGARLAAPAAARLVAAAEPYYASALQGLPRLPLRSAWAVAAARSIYREIGVEVVRRGERAWDRRAGASKGRKLALALAAGGAALASRGRTAGERPELWSAI